MKIKDVVLGLILIFLGISICLVFKVFNEAFNKISIFLIIIGYVIICFGVIYQNLKYAKVISFGGYIIILLAILFVRGKVSNRYSEYDYIKDWLNIIFTNKVVFINVIGNVVLYMPFMAYANSFIKKWFVSFLMIVIIIILGEFIQYLLFIGVFDIIDIILNIFGIVVVDIIYGVIKCVEKRKKIRI